MRTFNTDTLKQDIRNRRFVKPTMSINSSGTFSFNEDACKKLGIKEGDAVTLYEHEGKWYVQKSTTGFTVAIKKANGTDRLYLHFNHRALRTEVLDSLPVQLKSASFGIKPESVTLEGVKGTLFELHLLTV